MRLLLFAQQFRSFTSGLGTYARGLAEGLAASGHEVTVAVPASQVASADGIRTVPMDFRPGNVTPFARGRMARAHRAVLAERGAGHDLVHFLDAREATFLPDGLAGLPPVVGTVHDSYALDWTAPAFPRRTYDDRFLRGLYYRWLRGVERRAYRRLAGILTNSRHVSKAIAGGYGVPTARVEVVRIGLPDAPDAEPAELDGDPAVLFVGANFRRKGLPVLLAAADRVRGALPDLRVHVVGSGRRMEDVPGADLALWHGWLPNEHVRRMMAGADVFAMPSLVEAFGLVYLEAMRVGTPVIATSAGGVAECVSDGVEALLLPPGDVDRLAELLARLAGDRGLRERLAAGGRAAAARFTLDATVEATEEFYERVTERLG